MASRNRLESEAIVPEFVDRVMQSFDGARESSTSPLGQDSE